MGQMKNLWRALPAVSSCTFVYDAATNQQAWFVFQSLHELSWSFPSCGRPMHHVIVCMMCGTVCCVSGICMLQDCDVHTPINPSHYAAPQLIIHCMPC